MEIFQNSHQHRIPVPMAINVPNVPPPCNITLPTLLISSRPLSPYLLVQNSLLFYLSQTNISDDENRTKTYRKALNPPKSAPVDIPTQNPIIKPIFILSKQLGPCWLWYIPPGTGIIACLCVSLVYHQYDLRGRNLIQLKFY